MEAMAYGLPIIATRVGGIPHTMTDGVNGILVEPANSKQLSSAILQLVQNKKLYEVFSDNNIQRSKSYNWLAHTKEVMRVFR
jgi:glycosyltransferase involved in cell wall biosynthesis